MIRRLTNPTTYRIETTRAGYLVTLERINNDRNGNPRFSATIIVDFVKGEDPDKSGAYTVRFNFGGHYMSEKEEAAFIVRHYEKDFD